MQTDITETRLRRNLTLKFQLINVEWITTLFAQRDITAASVALRLLVSLVLGGLIGLERESRHQPAGLRTHILITLGSTLIMLVSIFIPQTYQNFQNGDPGRMAAQVVSGIGFLGAGAIFRLGANVRGLTTAATIWVSAAVGLAVGAGLYWGAAMAASVILFVLIVLNRVEKKYFPDITNKVLRVHFNTADFDAEQVLVILKKHKVRYISLSAKQMLDAGRSQVKFYIKIPNNLPLRPFFHDISRLSNVSEVVLGQDP